MEKVLKIILSLTLVICIVISAFIFAGGDEGERISIYIDSELYKTIDLSGVKEPYEMELPHNTLRIESDGVTVISADCPDKVCIKRGKMSGGVPIVCAPARLYIKVEDKEVDAVSWSKQKGLPFWRCFCAFLL